MPKVYKVGISSKARGQFTGHVKFLQRESLNAAKRLVSSYKKSIARIADNPFQFPFADELDISSLPQNTYRKCLFEERYKMLFKLEETLAIIVAVIDTRMENTDL
ncbi:MAG: hypothetical protein FWG02_09225 [Holophagaceae bacterium]|nr:hypothetical protein [Holophagaceae bacterium]